MDKKKLIYIGLLLIVTIFSLVTYFSYAFFAHTDEYHGKLNIVVGTLDYMLQSSELTDNSITLAANETKKFEITITSLNSIDSKYELYYDTNNNNIEVGYSSTTSNLPTGVIESNGKKKVLVRVSNNTETSAIITFKVSGGFINNELVLNNVKHIPTLSSLCNINLGTITNFDYYEENGVGKEQEYLVQCNGMYRLETWGAQGGSCDSTYYGGYGGYSVGIINLKSADRLNVVVGENGKYYDSYTTNNGTYNGGGGATFEDENWKGGTGGGSTDIAFDSNYEQNLDNYTYKNIQEYYDNRIIVAGGGGGAICGFESRSGGAGGGGTTSDISDFANGSTVYGATQTTPGYNSMNSSIKSTTIGGIGYGGRGFYGGGGGAGYYGGGGGYGSCGTGGSGYIANSNLTDKYMYCYGCSEDTNISTYTVSTIGNSYLKNITNCPDGYSSNPISKCAKAGNGYARITYIED